VLLGPFAIDVMPFGTEILVIPDAEPDEDLVPPVPDAMIGGPSAESPRLLEDFDSLHNHFGIVCRRSAQAREGAHNREQTDFERWHRQPGQKHESVNFRPNPSIPDATYAVRLQAAKG
jgi:hypothetical protein